MAIISVKNLSYAYGTDALAVNKVSFDVEEGTYTTIIGHNGSGKSTIAKLLMGLLEKKEGSITIDGLDLTLENLQKIRSRIGIVFQNPDNQFIGSTVRDDIAFGLENHQVPQPEMDPIIQTFAAQVKMTDYLDREPTRLSGGQKQRVAIAGVLAMHPKIIIFDEATSMLDPKGKDEIKQVIQNLHQETDITILSITHDIEEVAKSDAVLVLDQGQLVMQGKPEEVLLEEKKLVDIQLDIPFGLKLRNALKKQGVEVAPEITMEGLVDELCRYVSKP